MTTTYWVPTVTAAAAWGSVEMASILAQTAPFQMTSGTGSPPATGSILLNRAISQGGTTSTFNMYVVGAGVTITGVFAVAIDLAGNILAQTADRSADAALTGGNTLWSPPWITPAKLPAGDMYLGLLISTATTKPTFRHLGLSDVSTNNLGTTASPPTYKCANLGAGLSAVPASPVSLTGAALTAEIEWMAAT